MRMAGKYAPPAADLDALADETETLADGPETKVKEITAADIARERLSHLKRADELKAKLESGKDAEFRAVVVRVEEFNRIFGTNYVLADQGQQESPKPRLCATCRQSGHNKKSCPNKAA